MTTIEVLIFILGFYVGGAFVFSNCLRSAEEAPLVTSQFLLCVLCWPIALFLADDAP